MNRFAKHTAMAAIVLSVAALPAYADCNRNTGTETALGAGSGALVAGLASNSLGGAIIGGLAGGLIGNAIGQSNNREDCRRQAREAYSTAYDRSSYYRGRDEYGRSYYVDRYGYRHYYQGSSSTFSD